MSKRVLIADDHEDMRELLSIVLRTASYDVIAVATDGPEALELWRQERQQGVCAVILDQRMPGLSGVEVARAINADAPDQTVIILSAHLDADVEDEAHLAGVAACISKRQILDVPNHSALLTACCA